MGGRNQRNLVNSLVVIAMSRKTAKTKLNTHFKNTHQAVTCNSYSKSFLTPSTLACHKYVHRTLKFQCDHSNCDSRFTFSSELSRHKLIHRTHAKFQCQYPDCGRWYFSNSELIKHVKVHDGKIWKCDVQDCDYTTPDKRLLHQHGRVHRHTIPNIPDMSGKINVKHCKFLIGRNICPNGSSV